MTKNVRPSSSTRVNPGGTCATWRGCVAGTEAGASCPRAAEPASATTRTSVRQIVLMGDAIVPHVEGELSGSSQRFRLHRGAGFVSIIERVERGAIMRYAIAALVAAVTTLSLPSAADASSKSSFFFSFSSGPHGYYHRPYYWPGGRYYSSYGYGYGHYRPYYGGYYHGRYAVPRVYSPYRYGDYAGDRLGYYGYQYDRAYRRGYTNDYDRGYYYGPAVERYHRHARDYPSYHYDRREHYNRGTDRSYRDRGGRY